MFITGPSVIKQVTGECVSAEELGGPAAQINPSGVVRGAVALCRRLLSFLPSNNLEETPRRPYDAAPEIDLELDHVVPIDPKVAYSATAFALEVETATANQHF